MYVAGALHDIGKLIINNEILEKPGKLTDQEYLNIKDHAEASYIIHYGFYPFYMVFPLKVPGKYQDRQ